MESLVKVFFVAATLATLAVGVSFVRRGGRPFRYFGLGLVLNSVAFAIWTAAVLAKPESGLNWWVTVGVFWFFGGLVLFAATWVLELAEPQRRAALVVGAAWIVGVVALRLAYPSHPAFSDSGLFFFNPHGSVAAFEIFGLTAGMLPAIFRVARDLATRSAYLAKVGFTTLAVGGIILVTSHDEVLLHVDGWAMGLAFVALTYGFAIRRSVDPTTV